MQHTETKRTMQDLGCFSKSILPCSEHANWSMEGSEYVKWSMVGASRMCKCGKIAWNQLFHYLSWSERCFVALATVSTLAVKQQCIGISRDKWTYQNGGRERVSSSLCICHVSSLPAGWGRGRSVSCPAGRNDALLGHSLSSAGILKKTLWR